jgi:hypothetical protein
MYRQLEPHARPITARTLSPPGFWVPSGKVTLSAWGNPWPWPPCQ